MLNWFFEASNIVILLFTKKKNLANHLATGSRVCGIQQLCPLFRHIHLATKEIM
jgi:hypothetical protein